MLLKIIKVSYEDVGILCQEHHEWVCYVSCAYIFDSLSVKLNDFVRIEITHITVRSHEGKLIIGVPM